MFYFSLLEWKCSWLKSGQTRQSHQQLPLKHFHPPHKVATSGLTAHSQLPLRIPPDLILHITEEGIPEFMTFSFDENLHAGWLHMQCMHRLWMGTIRANNFYFCASMKSLCSTKVVLYWKFVIQAVMGMGWKGNYFSSKMIDTGDRSGWG